MTKRRSKSLRLFRHSSLIYHSNFVIRASAITGVLLVAAGCSSPSRANIELRKENQKLQTQIAHLNSQHEADVATIQSYERNRPAVPTLPEDRLEKLFTTHGIMLGRLTGGDDWDPSKPGDDGLKIYAAPVDGQGDAIKAAGSFKVQAFDLDDPAKPLIGTWTFNESQTRNLFYNHLMLYTYVLTCPWQIVPQHDHLTITVTFDDELTGREYSAQKQVEVNTPAQATK
jgi:hypothetical protein